MSSMHTTVKEVLFRKIQWYRIALTSAEYTRHVVVPREVFEMVLTILVSALQRSNIKTFAKAKQMGFMTCVEVYADFGNNVQQLYTLDYIAVPHGAELSGEEIVLTIRQTACLRVFDSLRDVAVFGSRTLYDFVRGLIELYEVYSAEPHVEVVKVLMPVIERFYIELEFCGSGVEKPTSIRVDVGSRDLFMRAVEVLRLAPYVSVGGVQKSVRLDCVRCLNTVVIEYVLPVRIDVEKLLKFLTELFAR